MSSGLGMYDRLHTLLWNDRLNPPVATQATPALRSYWERVEYSLTYLSFASFNAPYNPVRFMYENRIASIQFLILRLLVLKITITTVRPRLSKLLCFVKQCRFSKVSGKRKSGLWSRGHSGSILPTFILAPRNFVLPRKYFIKKYNKNRNLDSLKCIVLPEPLDLGYGFGLS